MVVGGLVWGTLGGKVCPQPARPTRVAAGACLHRGGDDRRHGQPRLGTIVRGHGFVVRKGIRLGNRDGRGLVKCPREGVSGLW